MGSGECYRDALRPVNGHFLHTNPPVKTETGGTWGRHYWKYGPYPSLTVSVYTDLILESLDCFVFFGVLAQAHRSQHCSVYWILVRFFFPPMPAEFFYRTENKSMNLCLQHRKRSIPHTRTSWILQFFYGSTVDFSNAPKFSNKINEIARRAEMG